MSAATVSANGQRPDAAERQASARDAYRVSLAAGVPLSGAAIGRQFDMSERWGRDRVAEVQRHAETNGNDHDRLAMTPVVTEPGAPRRHEPATLRDTDPANRDMLAGVRDEAPAADRAAAASRQDPVVREAVPAIRDDQAEIRDAGATAVAAADRSEAADRRSWLDSVIILVVAGVAAAASYGHMLEVATWAGEPLWIAKAFPITVDGLVLAALRRGRQGRWWLLLGIAVSVAANMLARYPDLAAAVGPVVSAWPPLALYGTHRLLHSSRRRGQRS